MYGFSNENILANLGIDTFPKKDQDLALEQSGRVIFQAILARVIPLLTNEDVRAVENLVKDKEGSKNGALIRFLITRIPNFEQIATEEITRFEEETKRVLGRIQDPHNENH